MLLIKNTSSTNSTMTLIYVLYGGLVVYFAYKIYKSFIVQKFIEGEVHEFNRPVNKSLYILGVFVLAFGGLNIYQGTYLIGGFMIALVILLIVESRIKAVLGDNGIIAGDKFIKWNQLKKWAFDKKRNELVILYKDGYNEANAYVKLKEEDIEEVNELIRKYRLKK